MNPRPHERSTQMFSGLAKTFHVDVEPFDNDKWSAAITMAKALDNLVDDDHIYDSGQYGERAIRGEPVPYLTNSESEFVRLTFDKLSEQSKEQWRNSATQLGAFAIKRLEAENIYDYMDVLREESLLLSSTLAVENDAQRNDQLQRDSFNSWLVQAVRTMYVLDTCSDFVKDHNEGNMNISISPQAIRELARSAIVESISFSRGTPVAAYPVLLRRSVTKTFEKVSQAGFWSNQFVWNRNR
jgi:hypothetical protein